MSEPLWTPVAPLADLFPGSLRTVKHGDHQLVLARTDQGAVHALDNRCPHEGYPLAQGQLRGCALTCTWHNWKFDLRDGACTVGGEAVRAYPTRVVEGTVEVDLADPDPRTLFPAWRESLAAGLFKHESDRAIRDGVRLLQGGYDPHRLLADVALYDARHAEYGTTHVLALAADLGRLLERRRGVDAMYAIAPVIDLCGESNRRLPRRTPPPPVDRASGESLRAAVEEEDAALAEGLVLGAFRAGVPRATIEGWLYGALSDHFLDFGHRLIYMVKARELLDRVGTEYAPEIYGSLVHSIVYGTREDTLPYMAPYAGRLAEVQGRLADVHRRARPEARLDPVESARLREAVLDGRSAEALGAVWQALEAGVPGLRVAEELVVVGAERLLRFDLALDRRGDVAENWLWATHRFTFASAVRNALARWDRPDALRFLFQGVMFLHSGRPMDAPPTERIPLEPEPASARDVLEAIVARRPERAVARTLGLMASGASLEPLEHGVEDLLLADPLVRPIAMAHGVKTAVAAFEEHAALEGHPGAAVPLAAALRFLASPLVERRLHQTVTTSIEWVVDDRVPRKLTQ